MGEMMHLLVSFPGNERLLAGGTQTATRKAGRNVIDRDEPAVKQSKGV
jgi:hypothetical protein